MTDNMQNILVNIRLRPLVWAFASCLVLSGISPVVQAAGLGRIVVFSALGQPLRAEIELFASREELSGMKAQWASRDDFRRAEVDYATILPGIRVVIDKRGNGQPVIELSSDRPVIDPFVDMLLEINWANSRLVRKYTFLLDPPELAGNSAVVESPADYRHFESSKKAAEGAASSARHNSLRAWEESRPPMRGQDAHQVRPGETLNKIASAMKREGVSLEQMLVGLYRANRDAFDGNMNSLIVGKILSVPEQSELESASQSEAKKIVIAQLSEWNVYRRARGSAISPALPGKEEDGKHETVGRLTAPVEGKAVSGVEPKEARPLSKVEAVAATRAEENPIAHESALREANDRVSGLEKNVADLLKLVELNNRTLAALQRQLAAKAVFVEPMPGAALPAAEKPLINEEENKPAEAAVASLSKLDPTPVAVTPPKQVEIIPAAAPPEIIEESVVQPMLLAVSVGILAFLAAYWWVKGRRQYPQKDGLTSAVRSALSARSLLGGKSTLTSQSRSSGPNPAFMGTGGQSIDSTYAPPHSDFSQTGPGEIDSDEVDLIAEADVYMAYGRDVQAEEILLEAKQKDPNRHAIDLRLLAIYAKRKKLDQFEKLATDFHRKTRGTGGDWEKITAMGFKLDPKNPLYAGGGASVEPEAAIQPSLSALEFVINTEASAKPLTESPTKASVVAPIAAVSAVVVKGVEENKLENRDVLPEATPEEAPLEFTSGDAPSLVAASLSARVLSAAPNFILPGTEEPVATILPPAQISQDLDFDLEFDVKMSESTVLGEAMQTPSFDMSSISLNLDHFVVNGSVTLDKTRDDPTLTADLVPSEGPSPSIKMTTEKSALALDRADENYLVGMRTVINEQVAIKLDLANAYEEMGDLEGARELFQEVLKEGDATQREIAQVILARIDR